VGAHPGAGGRASSPAPLSDSNARLAAARRLTGPGVRRKTGRFLAEGAPAVREALLRRDIVLEVFATAAALDRHGGFLAAVPVSRISERAAAALSETVHPQGLVAVCRAVDRGLDEVFARRPRLVAVVVEPNDPGNLGTILRTADAAGADALIVAGDGADLYNGKAVRASAGSLFHLDVVLGADPFVVIAAARSAGLRSLAATATGARARADAPLAEPSLWLFGNEARGLPPALVAAADAAVHVPIYGRAESLNLSAAAAVCLYASATAQRSPSRG
jgi:TrmH family RNA methyltransferase